MRSRDEIMTDVLEDLEETGDNLSLDPTILCEVLLDIRDLLLKSRHATYAIDPRHLQLD